MAPVRVTGALLDRILRGEIARLRTDVQAGFGSVRGEIAELRTDAREGFARVRGEIARDRFELMKWMFAFWVGQLFAVVGLMGLLARAFGSR